MNEVIVNDQPMVVQPQVTPMSMLQIAVQNNADIDKLKQLMDLQERWERNEAKKAYVEAKAAFNANPPSVYKDKDNKQYESRYTSIGNLVNTVNGELSKHGLSTRWDINQSAGITVTCILTHRMGHSEQCSMSGPPDTSGKKNPLQEIKSTVTYLKVATFEAVTGIASIDGNADDDGNGSGGSKGLTAEQQSDFDKRINGVESPAALEALWKEIAKACHDTHDKAAHGDFKAKVLIRSGELKVAA